MHTEFMRGFLKATANTMLDRTVFRLLLALPPRTNQAIRDVSIHTLASSRTWPMACAAVLSFLRFSKRSWPVFFHEDGSLDEKTKRHLKERYPAWTLVDRRIADRRLAGTLSAYPALREWRSRNLMMLKMMDPFCYAPSHRYIYIDSDVLFFNRPSEIIRWASDPSEQSCWYMREHVGGYAYSWPLHQIDAAAGREVYRGLNAGLLCFFKPAMDLSVLDQFLQQMAAVPISEKESWYVDQTLHALLLARWGKGGLLPRSYESGFDTQLRLRTGNRVCCHYVGATKGRIYYDGILRVLWRYWKRNPEAKEALVL